MVRGERKKFGIKPARKLQRRYDDLVNVVKVTTEQRHSYCYITYAPALLEFVGSQMPRGVAAFDPVYLEVEEDARAGKWLVWGCYYVDNVRALLWTSSVKPQWVTERKV